MNYILGYAGAAALTFVLAWFSRCFAKGRFTVQECAAIALLWPASWFIVLKGIVTWKS